MSLTKFFGEIVLAVFYIGGWVLYFRERSRSRDYVTDLMSVVYRNDLGRDDLRRSLNHDEVEKQLKRWTGEEGTDV